MPPPSLGVELGDRFRLKSKVAWNQGPTSSLFLLLPLATVFCDEFCSETTFYLKAMILKVNSCKVF